MKTIRFFTPYIHCEKASLSFARYGDGSIALRLTAADESNGDIVGEPLGTLTVCLEGYGQRPQEGHVFIKNYSEGQGNVNALMLAGVIGQPVRWIDVGYVENGVAECKLLVEVDSNE